VGISLERKWGPEVQGEELRPWPQCWEKGEEGERKDTTDSKEARDFEVFQRRNVLHSRKEKTELSRRMKREEKNGGIQRAKN